MAIPNSMDQLSAMVASGQFGAIPGMMPTPMPGLPAYVPPGVITPEQITALVDQRIKAVMGQAQSAPPSPDMTRLASIVAQVENLFQRALPAEDYAAFHAYTQAGAPGFGDIMKSEQLYPIVQLLWETIKENKK